MKYSETIVGKYISQKNAILLIIFSSFGFFLIPSIINYSTENLGLRSFISLNSYNEVFIGIFLFLFFIIMNIELFKSDYNDNGRIVSFVFFIISIFSYFVLLNIFDRNLQILYPGTFVFFSMFIYTLILFTLFLTVFGNSIYLKNKDKFNAFFLILIFYFALIVIMRSIWKSLAFMVGNSVYFISSYIFPTKLYYSDGIPTLNVSGFSAAIGQPCSGMESIILFSIFYIILVAYEKNKLNNYRVLMLFLIGNLIVFILNIFRVLLIMFVGTINPDFAINMFHENIGWVIFILFFGLFIFRVHDKYAVINK